MKGQGKRILWVGLTILLCVTLWVTGASAAHPGTGWPQPVDLGGLGDGVSDSSLNEYDREAISLMENSGTWGTTIELLLPYMSPGGVERLVAIYLERHLFPGVTSAESARKVEEAIANALNYMTDEAAGTTRNIIRGFTAPGYTPDPVLASPPKVDLRGLGSGIPDWRLSESDREIIAIMERTGTWTNVFDLLIPHMTPGGVEKVTAIYLERHLFPGITTAEGAREVAGTLRVALGYLSGDARQTVEEIIASF